MRPHYNLIRTLFPNITSNGITDTSDIEISNDAATDTTRPAYPCPVSSSDTNPSTGDAGNQNRYNDNLRRKYQASKYPYTLKLDINYSGLAFSTQHVHCARRFLASSSCYNRDTCDQRLEDYQDGTTSAQKITIGYLASDACVRSQLCPVWDFSADRMALGQVFYKPFITPPVLNTCPTSCVVTWSQSHTILKINQNYEG
jgi:hypothetical protein